MSSQSDHATAEIVVTPLALGDGTMTSYAACGDGYGTPLVFLHGLGDSWRSFERILPRLPRQTRAFAPTDALSDPIPPALIEDFQRGTAVQPVAPEFMEMAIAESLKVPAHVWQAAIRAFHEYDHLDGLASITVPVLLIWGDREPLVPRSDQTAFSAAIPSCELRVYEGTGHAVHWEQPDRFAADVVAFARAVTF